MQSSVKYLAIALLLLGCSKHNLPTIAQPKIVEKPQEIQYFTREQRAVMDAVVKVCNNLKDHIIDVSMEDELINQEATDLSPEKRVEYRKAFYEWLDERGALDYFVDYCTRHITEANHKCILDAKTMDAIGTCFDGEER